MSCFFNPVILQLSFPLVYKCVEVSLTIFLKKALFFTVLLFVFPFISDKSSKMFVLCPQSSLSFTSPGFNIRPDIFSSVHWWVECTLWDYQHLPRCPVHWWPWNLVSHIGFLSGDRHNFLFEIQLPQFHFSSYVSNISFYSSLVTNFRSFVSALLLDFKISQDFVLSFPSFPFLFWSVLSPLFQALDFINHRAANGSKNSLLPPFFLLSSRYIYPIAYRISIWVFLPIFQSQQVIF